MLPDNGSSRGGAARRSSFPAAARRGARPNRTARHRSSRAALHSDRAELGRSRRDTRPQTHLAGDRSPWCRGVRFDRAAACGGSPAVSVMPPLCLAAELRSSPQPVRTGQTPDGGTMAQKPLVIALEEHFMDAEIKAKLAAVDAAAGAPPRIGRAPSRSRRASHQGDGRGRHRYPGALAGRALGAEDGRRQRRRPIAPGQRPLERRLPRPSRALCRLHRAAHARSQGGG